MFSFVNCYCTIVLQALEITFPVKMLHVHVLYCLVFLPSANVYLKRRRESERERSLYNFIVFILRLSHGEEVTQKLFNYAIKRTVLLNYFVFGKIMHKKIDGIKFHARDVA